MRITKRDLQLLNDLYFVRYISSKRVGSLFGNYNSAMRRLKQLLDNKYIKLIDYLPSGERTYCLANRGFKLIDAASYSIKKTDKLYHSLACGDFYFYLQSKGHIINYFAIDKQIDRLFRPDIIVQTDRWYFVEIDLSNRRFEEKVKRWESYYTSMAFITRFNLFPPLIIVSTKSKRIQAIINKVQKVCLNYIFINYAEMVAVVQNLCYGKNN